MPNVLRLWEIILRDDGTNGDLGYSWPVQLDEKRVFVVYYFNQDNGTRHIAGTILKITHKESLNFNYNVYYF